MTGFKAPPIKGYQDVTEAKKVVVNHNKELEETVLRTFETLETMEGVDPRMMAIAKTKLTETFMWANRAVFQPGRVTLPNDNEE